MAGLRSIKPMLTLILLGACSCWYADAAYYSSSSRLYLGSYYYYSSYYYGSYSSSVVSVGAIIGAVIGGLTFIGLIVGLIVFLCCLRQRRRSSAAARARVPMAVVGGEPVVATVSPGGYPAAAPMGGLPYDYPKQGGYQGVSPPPPYAPGDASAYYNNGYANHASATAAFPDSSGQPPYPTPYPPAQQMPPPPTVEQQRF